MVTVDTKLRVFQYKILDNILFNNNMLVKLRKVEPPLCSLCEAKDETYIHLFHMSRKPPILRRQFHDFFSTDLDLASISPQSSIFGFLDDALEHKYLLNHILIFLKKLLISSWGKQKP